MAKFNFTNQLKEYPIVLLPSRILKSILEVPEKGIIEAEIPLEFPKKKYIVPPSRPQKINITHYKSFDLYHLGNLTYGFLLLLIGGALFSLIITVISEIEFLGFYMLLLIILTPMMLLGLIGKGPLLPELVDKTKEEEKSEEQFKKELEDYQKDYLAYKERKRRVEEEFNKELETWNHYYLTNEQNIILKLHQKVFLPPTNTERVTYPPKRGVSELQFIKLVKERLNDILFLDLSIINSPYCPDITIISSNLHIDVEIDEPYTMKDKQPIHYLGQDNNRNEYFLSHNWCIVRFAEEQISLYPEDCINTLISIIHSIKERKNFYSSKLKHIPVWTYEDAVIKGALNHRKKYLKT